MDISDELPHEEIKLKELITLRTAKNVAKSQGVIVSTPTIIKWIKENRLGYQPGGSGGIWYVYRLKFEEYIKGESHAKKK